jgi:tricorn protease-like protein
MVNIYVKLKKEYCEQPNAMAKDVYGTLIYPNDNYKPFKESYLPLLKKHRDYESFDIKTQEVIDGENQDYQTEINDLATGNWKRAEKIINQMDDKKKLQDIKKVAVANERKIIVRLVDDRLEELG